MSLSVPRQQLRTRAVLREASTAQRHERRPRKHPPFCLLPSAAESLPALAAWQTSHDHYPPPVTRSPATAIRRLHELRAAYGQLVFLRLSTPGLDALPLESAALRDGGKAELQNRLAKMVTGKTPFLAAVQRGAEGGTHIHAVLPLSALLDDYRSAVSAARPGPGGGCELPDVAGHGVVIRDTVRDRERVGGYLRRHPDARLDTPGTLAYLNALDDEARRKREGVRLPRLGWDSGVQASGRLSTKQITLDRLKTAPLSK